MEILDWLQNWYHTQCNGDWEHSYGLKITTLDNPGWSVQIDLEETVWEGISIEYKMFEVNETDWYCYKIENNKFIANGDPTKLKILIEKFKEVIASHS